MKYKNKLAEDQFKVSPLKLQEIALYFELISQTKANVEPVITRIKEPVAGDSGVHEAGRAVDFRYQVTYTSSTNEKISKTLYERQVADDLVNEINLKYPRHDSKPTMMLHSFGNGPLHFHLQIPLDWAKR